MPREIEIVLNEHPQVAEAHVIGLPHERMGEVVCAFVVPRDPANPPEPAQLTEHCAAGLARFKVPRHVLYITAAELPLTSTGRVQKFRLTEMAKLRMIDASAKA